MIGEQKKGRFDKGGNKVWPKYGKGERNYELRPGGIRFLIIRMYNKVLNGQSKTCLQDLLSEQHHAKQLSVSYTFFCMFQIVARASQAFLWYSQFFSESELRFSRNYYIIIPFQIEWPDRTS